MSKQKATIKKKVVPPEPLTPPYRSLGITWLPETKSYDLVLSTIQDGIVIDNESVHCSNWTSVLEKFKIVAAKKVLDRRVVRI